MTRLLAILWFLATIWVAAAFGPPPDVYNYWWAFPFLVSILVSLLGSIWLFARTFNADRRELVYLRSHVSGLRVFHKYATAVMEDQAKTILRGISRYNK